MKLEIRNLKFLMRITFTICVLIALMCYRASGQDTTIRNFYSEIKNYNLSILLANDTGNGASFPLGFVGNNFQRFYVHFSHIIKNATQPYEYEIHGKTKLKNEIHTFSGSMIVMGTQTYKYLHYKDFDNKFDEYLGGWVDFDVSIYEDTHQTSSGFIRGTLRSYFFFDKKGILQLDTLEGYSDGYNNNQFVGKWTSYGTHEQKKCNWGDYRIPESDSLDIGAGGFSPNPKYLRYGWANFSKAFCGDSNSPESKKARLLEEKQWWK